ncbi:MAG TPA: hypothetical protein VMR34_04960 [Candidatus Saccharimonadales bacterium]|nr:hypothetical protein [Candidatus Saccharimonadales bacterium]
MSRNVTQRHEMACGLACVAFVTGESYDDLAEKETDRSRLINLGFLCPELVEILDEHGKEYGWKELSEADRNREFRGGDIVFVERSEKLPYGHFLVKAPEGWMDPWINLSQDADIRHAESGFRDSLPGTAEYLVYPLS